MSHKKHYVNLHRGNSKVPAGFETIDVGAPGSSSPALGRVGYAAAITRGAP